MTPIINYGILGISMAWVLFQFWLAAYAPFPALIQRPIHLAFALALAFLFKPFNEKMKNRRGIDIVCAVLALAGGVYMVTQYGRIQERLPFLSEVTFLDIMFGIIFLVLIMEAVRRFIGNTLAILALIFLVYCFVGPLMPGLLRHSALSLKQVIDLQVLSLNGIFGMALQVNTDYIFYFIVFASLLGICGLGDLLLEFMMKFKFIRNSPSGPAMLSVIGSTLMGMVSGSAAANASSIGSVTIPLMKRIGYSPIFAAAIEASASTGGQLMPPVMGAASFIMAQLLGVSYWEVAKVGFIPALLFYFVLGVLLYQESKSNKSCLMDVADRGQLVEGKKGSILYRLPLLIPFIYLIYGLIAQISLMVVAFRSIVLLLILSFILKKITKITWSKLLEAIIGGCQSAAMLSVTCGAAGIVIGSMMQSGLMLNFSALLAGMAGGHLLPLLLLSMVALIILGMGIPTVAVYMIGAIIFVPALLKAGINIMAAHYFVFYFGVIGMITPPEAAASFAAASIAGADLMKTGWKAFRLSIVVFLIPFSMVFFPGLLLQGGAGDIISALITALVSSIFFSVGISGCGLVKAKMYTRILLGIGGAIIAINHIYLLSIIVTLALVVLLYFDRKNPVPSPSV
jgi:TRAP transporter 4TM/12TM fusion protein